jgi:hypothetical protein
MGPACFNCFVFAEQEYLPNAIKISINFTTHVLLSKADGYKDSQNSRCFYEFQLKLNWGVVVRVPGYRSRGPVSIPGATRISEK